MNYRENRLIVQHLPANNSINHLHQNYRFPSGIHLIYSTIAEQTMFSRRLYDYVKQRRRINLIRNKLVSPQTCKLRSCVFNLYPFTNYLYFIDCWGITGSSKSLLRLYFRFSTLSKSHFLANSFITWKVRLISACCVCSSTDVKRFIQKLANMVLEGLFSFTKKKGCSLREGYRTDSTTLMGNFTLWRKENFALCTHKTVEIWIYVSVDPVFVHVGNCDVSEAL